MLGCPLTTAHALCPAVAACGLETSIEGKLDGSWKKLGFSRHVQ